MDLFSKYHWIENFPKGYPFYKKAFANFVYFLTGIIIHPRKNLLNHKDLIKARFLLRKGDIVLFGNLREVSSLFIKGALTHATLYLGHRKFIHAAGDGVQISSMFHLFTEYDTMIIMRLPKVSHRKKIIRKAIDYAKKQLGRPYDFEFKGGMEKIFCTELINESFLRAGHETKLKTFAKVKTFEERVLKMISSASLALRPVHFMESNFDLVFMSHNLKLKKEVVLKN